MDMIKKKAAMRGQGGFTLVELLVAVAILAILAGVAVFAIGNLTEQSGVAACNTEGETLVTAYAAAEASPSPTDTAGDYVEGGLGGLKYFDGTTGARINTDDVPDSGNPGEFCGSVTLPAP